MKAGVAGAGIMGRLLAYALQQEGWEVSLFDQGETRCSDVAAGLLSPVSELEKNDFLIYQLGMEAINQHWPLLSQQLDHQIFFKKMGSLVVAHPRDYNEVAAMMKIISNKLEHNSFSQKLSHEDISTLEPEITKFREGYYFPTEGQVDSQAVMMQLEEKLSHIQWHKNSVVQEVAVGKIADNKGVHEFDMVFDCRGLGGHAHHPDVRGVRGELVWLHANEVTIHRPIRLMHPRYSLYVVPRPGNIYLVGASEIEANDQSNISVRTLLELLTAAYSLHPGFSEARVIKMATHSRPTLTHHLPSIKYQDGLLAINGLYRHGYLIAPTLMKEVMRWLSQGIQSVSYPVIWEKCA